MQGEKAAQAHDPKYISFLTRVSRGGSKQVLRYCRNKIHSNSSSHNSSSSHSNTTTTTTTTTTTMDALSSSHDKRVDKGRLYLSSIEYAKTLKTCGSKALYQPCERCGAPRVFEFQVESCNIRVI